MQKGRKENLINPANRTSEELRAMTRKGGIASGEARRKRKTFRELAEVLLTEAKLSEPLKMKLKQEGVSDEDLNHMTVMVRGQIAEAENGNTAAFNAVLALVGEKPDEKISLNGGLSNEIKVRYIGDDGKDVHFPSSEDEIDMERK